jgi:hypothetical protein
MGNPNDAWMQEGAAHARRGLVDMIGRHMPDHDPEELADILISRSGEPMYWDVVEALDGEIAQSAQGHPRGITADERAALGGNRFMPDYLLGPGDQKAYAALRDSNLLNAAVGRRPVASIDDLIGGANYREGEEAKPLEQFSHGSAPPGFERDWNLANAGHDYNTASQMPTRHSTFFGGSPYPQHQWIGQPSTLLNSWNNNRDGVLGQAMGAFDKWGRAAKAAGRTPGAWGGETHGIDGTVGAVAKWGANFPPQLEKAEQAEWGGNAVGRGSPLVPNGLQDPQLRQDSIDNLKHFTAQASETPDVFTYGKSVGRGYSPALGWAFDMGTEIADPLTAASLGASFAPKVMFNVASGGIGRGVLRSLADDAPRFLAKEAGQEAASPITWGVGALTFPKMAGALTGENVTPADQAKAAAEIEAQHKQTNAAVQNIRQMKKDY